MPAVDWNSVQPADTEALFRRPHDIMFPARLSSCVHATSGGAPRGVLRRVRRRDPQRAATTVPQRDIIGHRARSQNLQVLRCVVALHLT